jgi:hypothetical protein
MRQRHGQQTWRVLLLIAMAAGCAAPGGDRNALQAPATPSTISSRVPAFPDPLRAPTAGTNQPAAPAPTAPRANPTGQLLSVPWTLAAISTDQRRIVVRYTVDGCTKLSHASLKQSNRSVEVGVVLEDNRGSGLLCPASTRVAVSTVIFARPLGDRVLLHAPSGP